MKERDRGRLQPEVWLAGHETGLQDVSDRTSQPGNVVARMIARDKLTNVFATGRIRTTNLSAREDAATGTNFV
jgi:hypothetical protein